MAISILGGNNPSKENTMETFEIAAYVFLVSMFLVSIFLVFISEQNQKQDVLEGLRLGQQFDDAMVGIHISEESYRAQRSAFVARNRGK